MLDTVELRKTADKIDSRLGPLPGAMADDIAVKLREAATELERSWAAFHDEHMEHELLKDLLSRPEIDEFTDGLMLEAAHQRQRWGDAHDRDKSAENWFWLVGYLAGKALRSAVEGDQNKARHHTISSAAALFQWWKAISKSPNGVGADDDLSPPIGGANG